MKSRVFIAIAATLWLAGCGTGTQSRYGQWEAGQSMDVEFGTVLASRPVDIRSRQTGIGAGIGGLAGGVAMSEVGRGSGNTLAIIGGAVAGAALGALAENALGNSTGVEYTITLASGRTITIVQNLADGDRVFVNGEAVMVQTGADYQRVVSAEHLPDTIKKPKQVRIAP